MTRALKSLTLALATMGSACLALSAAPAHTQVPAPAKSPAPQASRTAPTAIPAAHTTIGEVKSWSPANRTLTLTTGKVYFLAEGVTGDFKPGDQVSVHWKIDGAKRMADAVTKP